MDKNGEWQPKVASLKSLRSKLRSREGSPIRSPQMPNGHYRTRSADLSSVIDRKYIASNSLSPRVTSPIGRPPTPPRRTRRASRRNCSKTTSSPTFVSSFLCNEDAIDVFCVKCSFPTLF